MNRILRKDPIVEAVCAFRFKSSDWDWTVPGLLWGQLREEFPLKQQFDLVAPETPLDSDEAMGVSQLNFWRADKTALVRTQPNELGVVQRAPYSGWPSFKATIERVLKTYREVAPTSELKEISLRYMNQLPLPPENEFDVGHYLNVLPTVPKIGEGALGAWMQQVNISKPDEKLLLIFKAGMVPVSEGNDLMMIMDFSARGTSKDISDGEELAWLEVAHQQIEYLFFACLKQPYLDILELEENDNENSDA